MVDARLSPPRGVFAALSWLVFPLLLTAVFTATRVALSTDLPKPVASGAVLAGVIVLVLVLERIAPLYRAWNARPDIADLALLVLNRGIDLALLLGTVTAVNALGSRIAFLSLWPRSAPVLVQVALGLVLADTIRYGLHRLSHVRGLLMRVHVTHHAPARMYSLNGPRLHPLNYLWVSLSNTVPLLLLGAEVDVVITVINVTAFFVLFQHANLSLRFDGLNRVFATPDVHRLHHARELRGEGVNYAIVLIVLDRLFGTFRPAGDEPSSDGIGWRAPRSAAQ
jgi:sterol desaturase/sphingolipid hydroxylase (fatty acid hydroxylase superfamily)